jgi:hypothetical protein
MAESSPRAAKDPQSEAEIPAIGDLLKLLSCCVTGAKCQHDISPWGDSDLELQAFSTAALEALQEHTMHRMEPFLHWNGVLGKEIASRKLESRFANSNAGTISKQPREILFDINDFGWPITLLGGKGNISEAVCGHPESEHRDVIAKMSLAWVSETRETARLRRPDDTRPTSAKHRNADEAAVVIDIEGAETSSILFEDVEDLEDEMESYT